MSFPSQASNKNLSLCIVQGAWPVLQHWEANASTEGNDQTAVVAALSFWDYSLIAAVQGSDTYKATGRCFSVAAGRISYTYSLKGGLLGFLRVDDWIN